MEHPEIDPKQIQNTITGTHWELDKHWLRCAGISQIPGHYLLRNNPELPPIWIDDLWEYIQSLYDVFPEPLCVSLALDMEYPTTMGPIRQILHRMSSLTGLKLMWISNGYDVDENDDEMQQIQGGVTTWISSALSPSQLTQLRHLWLFYDKSKVDTNSITGWLKEMPRLRSFNLSSDPDAVWANPLHIPPLIELSRLQIFCLSTLPLELYVPVLPSLKSFLVAGHSFESPSWLPNLKMMTALVSLRWMSNPPDFLAIFNHLPPQLEKVHFIMMNPVVLSNNERDTIWTNLMKLTQLTCLIIPQFKIPNYFLEWMKTSHIAQVKSLFNTVEPSQATLLAQILPEMKHLKTLEVSRLKECDWMAPILQVCTQLTKLSLPAPKENIQSFVLALGRLHNLTQLKWHHPGVSIPTEFYTLHFPDLVSLSMLALICETDLPAFANFLERHPGLTSLDAAFATNEQFETQVWDMLLKCPALIYLQRHDHVSRVHNTLHHHTFPPTLRLLTWSSTLEDDVKLVDLPKSHALNQFQRVRFENNIRRHRTLVDLHIDWGQFFSPLLPFKM